MAKVKTANRSFVTRLIDGIHDGFAELGIDAKVTTEPIKGTKLHRVYASSPAFKNLRHSERQGLAWRIIDDAFPPNERLRISMILTLTPDEIRGN